MASAIESSRFPDSNRKKRRKLESRSDAPAATSSKQSMPWRSESQRRIYSAKLIEALFRVRSRTASSPGSVASSGGVGEVRGIADRVLATAAKGRTRWSRALLANRSGMAGMGKRLHRRVRPVGGGRLRKERSLGVGSRPGKVGRLRAVERRVKLLGRLVPGCRGISVTNLLEEATDYIAALEMQVKAMTALSQLLGSPAVRSSALDFENVDDVSLPSVRC